MGHERGSFTEMLSGRSHRSLSVATPLEISEQYRHEHAEAEMSVDSVGP